MYVRTYEIDFGPPQRIRAEETQHDTETTKRSETKRNKRKAKQISNEMKSNQATQTNELSRKTKRNRFWL